MISVKKIAVHIFVIIYVTFSKRQNVGDRTISAVVFKS